MTLASFGRGECLPGIPGGRRPSAPFLGTITIIIGILVGFAVLAQMAGNANLATLAGTAACGLALDVARRLLAASVGGLGGEVGR
ncbi:MAG TPA: hypothetical protein VJT31_28555 [Rugosimonospora sp.]|nr:hypothetical protein [Rugosimonospora sp.]